MLWKLIVPEIVVRHRILPHTGERVTRPGNHMFSIVIFASVNVFVFLTFEFLQARNEAPSAASSVDSSVDTTASVDEGISDLSTHETIINPSTGNEKFVFNTFSQIQSP